MHNTPAMDLRSVGSELASQIVNLLCALLVVAFSVFAVMVVARLFAIIF
jgi:hypothetical protein